MPEPEAADALPEDIPLDVVYEDEDVIVVNKPVGMVVHPAPGHPDGTLVNALLHHCGESLSGGCPRRWDAQYTPCAPGSDGSARSPAGTGYG